MADQSPRRPAPGRSRQPGGPQLPGWRITPAPDGRGRPQPGGAQPPRSGSRWPMVAVLVVVLLVANIYFSSQVLQPTARVQIPYSPTFLTQVENKNVSQV